MADQVKPLVDWRKLPRKPGKLKKSRQLTVRVTEAECSAIIERAGINGSTVSDFIVKKCLGKKARNDFASERK